MIRLTLLLAVIGSLCAATTTSAIVVSLPASKDNTLYESNTGAVSNGAGDYVFDGITREGFKRRAVMAFDVAGVIPAGSTIQ